VDLIFNLAGYEFLDFSSGFNFQLNQNSLEAMFLEWFPCPAHEEHLNVLTLCTSSRKLAVSALLSIHHCAG